VISVYVAALFVLIGFLILVVPLLAEQVTTIIRNIPHYYQSLLNGLLSSSILFLREIAVRMPGQLVLQQAPIAGIPATSTPDVQQLADLITHTAFILISVLVLAYYWTLNGERTLLALLLRFPLESRENARQVVTTMVKKVGAFLRGQSILCLAVGAMMLVALLMLQLPYALSLALLAAVFEAIPILGPTLGAIPVVLVTLATAPDKIVWVIAAVIIIQQIESNVLIPRVMDKSVGVNPIVTLLSVVAFGGLLGLPGALLAIPMAAIIQVLISYIVFKAPEPAPLEEGRGRASVLRYKVQQLRQDIRKQLRDKERNADGSTDELEDMIESIATDVDHLLADRDRAVSVEDNS
jgi:predicted PurR-regulated permease PerM